MEKTYNPLENAQAQFDKVAAMINLDEAARALLREPLREFHFQFPVRMDDGSTRVFRGYRMQHNDARGPAKGGLRFHPHETADMVRALSMWMTWKTAVLDLPLGGGKGGIVCDAKTLSEGEQERMCRGYMRQLARIIGPNLDVPAPDVSSSGKHMLWMLDEYEAITGAHYPGAITGKPVGMGGSLGRTEATGYGVVYTLRELLSRMGKDITATTMSVQGLGNAAQYCAQLYHALGGRLVAMSNSKATYVKRGGFDPAELIALRGAGGALDEAAAKAAGFEVLPADAWITQEVDILAPCAIENQITPANAGRIAACVSVIAEGANGPTTPDCDDALTARGITVLPDFLCNAGGVTCSYFEQVQCNMNYYWPKDEVLLKLDAAMIKAFAGVYDLAKARGLSLRDAAYIIAIERVAQAARMRGWLA